MGVTWIVYEIQCISCEVGDEFWYIILDEFYALNSQLIFTGFRYKKFIWTV